MRQPSLIVHRPTGLLQEYLESQLTDATSSLSPTGIRPASGWVRVKGVCSCPNAVLHPWLKAELATILATLPEPELLSPEENRQCWERWQTGVTVQITLPPELPPLRMLLILDNLTGYYTVDFVRWLFAHGIMPLYTPLGGSWLNMVESMQRILTRRALDGQHPKTPDAVHLGWPAPSPAGAVCPRDSAEACQCADGANRPQFGR